MEETQKKYCEYLENIVTNELIKQFNFNINLKKISKTFINGNNEILYIFADELGRKWDRLISVSMWREIAYNNPNTRPRKTK